MVCAVPRGNDFTNACSFVFHVPVGGYAEAARPYSRVTLSSDRRLLSLRVPSMRGTLITIR